METQPTLFDDAPSCRTAAPNLFEFSDDERAFLEVGPLKLPDSFIAEIRCRRLGISRSNLDAMRSYDRALELADERAIICLPGTESIRPLHLNWELIDAIAKRESRELAQEFQEFLSCRKAQEPESRKGRAPSSRKAKR